MFDILNSYLFQHKSISIPGLGTIYLETLPSSIDITTKKILPPLYYFRFDKYFDVPDKDFFSFIGNQKKMPEYEALKWYNEFSYALRSRVSQEEKVKWEGVGELKKDFEGNTVFESSLGTPFFWEPVPARQVIHPNAQHVLLVGDRERTNFEMNEWLNKDAGPRKKIGWWVYALILSALAIGVLIFHFANNGWRINSVSNQQVLQLGK
jgi:hypothetical protein